MVSLVVIMSAVQQILVGVATSFVVAGVVGFGSANFFIGSLESDVKNLVATVDKYDMSQMNADIQLNTQRNNDQDKRIDNFESLVVKGIDEQRNQWNMVFDELKSISVSVARQEGKIGAIEVDITEIKEGMR